MQAIINGMPIIPIFKISRSPSLIPRQIIPNLRINFKENFIPGKNIEGIFKIFPNNRPIIIESIIGDIGLLLRFKTSLPIKLLRYIPEYAIIKLIKIPGKILNVDNSITISYL